MSAPLDILQSMKNNTKIITLLQELVEVKQRVYDPLGFRYSQPIMEAESAEYGAYTFELNGFSVRFRVAKITPTKIGQFVTLWKRLGSGPIQPYDMSDPVDFLIVHTRKDDRCGQFIFPKSVLVQQDVFSINGNGGKRAIRVYPPWDITQISNLTGGVHAWAQQVDGTMSTY